MSTFQAPRPGILPAQSIETLIAAGAITSDTPFDADQVQPASLDLRLSDQAWRVRASFLPGKRKVEERIADVAMHAIEITDAGVVLEKGCVYIVRLQERLKLPQGLIARANPKSSTGRVDVFVRLLTDRGASFDDVDEGYDGPLYMEVAPQTFSILVRPGTRLNQLRLKAGDPPKLETRSVGVDLQSGDIVGFRGRRHAGVVDLDVAGDAQTLAAALNHSAFNTANAIGPLLGGMAIAAGYGWTSTAWVGVALSLGGFVIFVIAWLTGRKHATA